MTCTTDTTCTQCLPLHYLVDYSGTVPFCSPNRCPPGMYSDENNKCFPCLEGTFNDGTNASPLNSCLDCLTGYFNPSKNQSACIACPKGTFLKTQRATSASQCSLCPISTYGDNEGRSTDCTNCPTGTFNLATGQEACMSKKKSVIYIVFVIECPVNCATCASKITCDECLSAYWLDKSSDPYRCDNDCPPLTFKDTSSGKKICTSKIYFSILPKTIRIIS